MSRSEDERRFEVVGMQLWRRLVLGGEGPELTLAEAAAALGVSVETVRRRIRSGEITARRDGAGHYRIVPLVAAASADEERETLYAWAEEASRLEKELVETRQRLETAQLEQEALAEELSKAREAESQAQSELSGLWERLNSGLLHLAPGGLSSEDSGAQTNERVQNVILDARRLFKRRRHRWPLLG